MGVDLGVDNETHSVDVPVKSICSSAQIMELSKFVQGTDPAEAHESLSDSTLFDLSEEGGGYSPLSPEALVQLCRDSSIPAVLGVNTRLGHDDQKVLLELAERRALEPLQERFARESGDQSADSIGGNAIADES